MNEQNRNSHPSPQHSFMAIEAILNTPKTEYVSIGFVLLSGNSVPMAFSTNYVFLRASGFAGSARCGNTILSRNANATYLRSSAMVEHQSKWGDRSSAPKSRIYNEDEMQYVWFQRIDLGLGWNEIHENFDRQFPDRKHLELRDTRRLQQRFYRIVKKNCMSGPK